MTGDLHSRGLWEASAPAAPDTSTLVSSTTVDVAIIGAGFTGLSTALHLAQAGVSTAVIEARDIGHGGSGRNVGLVNAGLWTPPDVLIETLGPVYGPRLLQLLGNGPALVFDLVKRHGMDCEAVHKGTLHCAVGSSGLQDITERARQWQALGAPVQVLDADETAQKIGCRAYQASLLDMRAGTIQPLAYARGLARAALQAGCAIHTNSAVSAMEQVNGKWRLQTAGCGTVDAQWVVVATNAYSQLGGPFSRLREELVHLPYFNLATVPLDASLRDSILPERQGAWDSRQVLSSFRFDEAGRLVFGSVGALRGAGLAIHRNWGRRALTRLFPQLAGVQFEYEWYGNIGMTTDAMPRFHQWGDKLISFSGYNGRGIAPGTVFGREIARLILGEVQLEDLPLPVSPATPIRFRALRELGYEAGACAVHALGARFQSSSG